MKDSFEQLKESVRKLRNEEFVPGTDLLDVNGVEYLVTREDVYKVQGLERLRLTKVESTTVEASVRRRLEEDQSPAPERKEGPVLAPDASNPALAPSGAPKTQEKPRPLTKEAKGPRETVKCEQCGAEFLRSKYNPYLTACNACRRKDRRTGGQDRKFTCLRCGSDFFISKYQPYIKDPKCCPRCSRNACISRRKKRVAAQDKANKQALKSN